MFTITADNPKGLNFDCVAEDAMTAKNLAKRVLSLGGVNLKINGKLVPDHILASK